MPEVHEEFGPEQARLELLEKAQIGMRAVNEAIQAGVVRASLMDMPVLEIEVDKNGFIIFTF